MIADNYSVYCPVPCLQVARRKRDSKSPLQKLNFKKFSVLGRDRKDQARSPIPSELTLYDVPLILHQIDPLTCEIRVQIKVNYKVMSCNVKDVTLNVVLCQHHRNCILMIYIHWNFALRPHYSSPISVLNSEVPLYSQPGP